SLPGIGSTHSLSRSARSVPSNTFLHQHGFTGLSNSTIHHGVGSNLNGSQFHHHGFRNNSFFFGFGSPYFLLGSSFYGRSLYPYGYGYGGYGYGGYGGYG